MFADKNASTSEAEEVLLSFINTAEAYSNQIVLAIAAEMQRYVNYYSVNAARGPDEFKLVYFTGSRLAGFLERDGYTLCCKVVQHSMVLMLDDCLKKYVGERGRPELKERMIKLITDGKVEECLGSHGLYLIYKCSANLMSGRTANGSETL